jgi:predicted AlkP superfamily pyrophosphatase or phosphodiesterase
MFPTVFGLLRDACPDAEIGYEYEWDGLHYLAELPAMNFAMEVKNYKTNQDTTFIVACDYIRKAKPNLFALIVDEPDHVGHVAGHDTPGYYDVLHRLDGYIGQIIEAVKEAGIYDETIFIITADHGGLGKGHEGMSMQEMETPFIIAGKNVKSGWCFDDLSIMQFDVASTISYIFRLEQPQAWIGRPMKVFIEE